MVLDVGTAGILVATTITINANQGFFQENDITVGMRVDLTNVLKKEDNG